MKVGIQTWGSHGDIRPFVALAKGLHAAGHAVTLVVTCVDSERYGALRSTLPFELRIVATPVVADARVFERVGAAIVAERDAIRQTSLAIEHFLLPAEAAMYEASEHLCAECDVVIGHYFLYTLGAAAEKHGRPYVSVVLAHGGIPSAHQPPAGVPNLGAFGNRLAWRLARWVLNRGLKKYPDRLRAAHGLAPARDLIDAVWASADLTLVAISPVLCEARPDWPRNHHVCGALDPRESVAEGEVPESLRSFLDAGAAPVYLTFGSMMSGSDERQTIAMLVDAARKASARAIVQAPHREPLGFRSDGQIHFVDVAPHAAVFPHCQLVVHHGGAGTSQAALRAGVPSVVVPYTAEQAMWGRELQRLRVAPPPIPRQRATATSIASAIREITQSGHALASARSIGARIAYEDGVAMAVRLINDRFAV